MADKVWRRGHCGPKADTGQTQGGQGLDTRPKRTQGGHMADASRSHGRHMADKVWRRGQKGLKADTRRTQGGHMADTRRTSSGDAARAYRGQLFFPKLRENPTANCLGNNNVSICVSMCVCIIYIYIQYTRRKFVRARLALACGTSEFRWWPADLYINLTFFHVFFMFSILSCYI